MQKDHRIDAQTAFVAITLFNILRFAVLVAPIMFMELVKVGTSFNPLYTGGLFHCYMLDESICHFWDVQFI